MQTIEIRENIGVNLYRYIHIIKIRIITLRWKNNIKTTYINHERKNC